jgi:hypothetical protein
MKFRDPNFVSLNILPLLPHPSFETRFGGLFYRFILHYLSYQLLIGSFRKPIATEAMKHLPVHHNHSDLTAQIDSLDFTTILTLLSFIYSNSLLQVFERHPVERTPPPPLPRHGRHSEQAAAAAGDARADEGHPAGELHVQGPHHRVP